MRRCRRLLWAHTCHNPRRRRETTGAGRPNGRAPPRRNRRRTPTLPTASAMRACGDGSAAANWADGSALGNMICVGAARRRDGWPARLGSALGADESKWITGSDRERGHCDHPPEHGRSSLAIFRRFSLLLARSLAFKFVLHVSNRAGQTRDTGSRPSQATPTPEPEECMMVRIRAPGGHLRAALRLPPPGR